MKTSRRFLLASLFASASALAAPDETALGKDEGYPVCPANIRPEPRCLVGLVSRADEIFRARTIAKGLDTRALERAPRKPTIRYSYQTIDGDVDTYLARNRTTGLLILKGDTILVERYQYDRKPSDRMASYSMAKTFVGMLIGIALAEGTIRSLDDTAATYVAELKDTPYGETPLRHLLTMSSGVRFIEVYSGSDDVFTLGRLSVLGESAGGAETVMPFRTRERPPGERFSYASAETQVLGLVLRAATGKPLAEYLSERIWQPMGAESDGSWLIDRGGYEAAFFGINATVRDYARFGMLLANDGALGGGQIIPAAWVRAATSPAGKQFEPGRTNMLFGYGYQTWTLPGNEREFVARGLRGQAIFVAPKSKIVMVHTAAGDVGFTMGELVSFWSGVVASLTPKPKR